MTKIDYPGDLGDEEFGYTNTGNVQWKKDGSGYVTLYKYDTYYRLSNVYYNYTGSLTTIVYPQTADVTYSYLNGTSMKSSMVDSTGTSSYGYDYKDRLISYIPPKLLGHGAITYTYNTLGQKTSVTNGSFVVNYSYFANGWLRDVKRSANDIAAYTYDQVGNRTQVMYGNGTYQTYTYNPTDPRYQLDKIDYAYRCGTGQPVAVQGSIGLTRDNSGNPLTWSALDMSTPQKNIYSKAYSYDQMSRLDSANYPGKGTTDFQYDWVGNRINPGNMEYNASDQLTRWPGQHRYEYDGRGNLIYEKSDDGTLQKTYAYTYSNLTLSITYAGVNKASLMTWDASGNRITFQSSTRVSDADTYTFVYDPTAGIPAVIEEVTPTGTNRYIREPGGELIARVATVGETETTHYYHFDELGSTQFLSSTYGVITDKYSYDSWGNVISNVGNIHQPYQYVGRLGYYVHYQDVALGLTQTGLRLMNTSTGMYIQRDIMFCMNAYIYGAACPTSFVDVEGEKAKKAPWNIPPDYGVLPQIMVCYRPLDGLLGKWARHAFLIIGRIPIGYGPGGVEQITTDLNYVKRGINTGCVNAAKCYKINANSMQSSCLKKLRDNYLDGNPLNDPVMPEGPWCASGCNGGYNFMTHNCGNWVNDALLKCGIGGTKNRVPNLFREGVCNYGNDTAPRDPYVQLPIY